MYVRFEPIAGKTAEIIEALMSSEDMTADESLRFKLRLCIEEAVENIVQYAYKGGQGYVEVGTSVEDGVLTVLLKDSGVPFNPLAKEDPDITLAVEDRPIGGLGIFLCKQMMDSLEYEYSAGCNVLRMKKRI